MKSLFTSKHLEISLVKGFVLGLGWTRNTLYIAEYGIFLGPLVFEITTFKKDKKKPLNEL
jgi:hypothetical protein